MKKELYDKLKARVDELERLLNGGKGSGNFGHAGRPGKVGGSSSSGASVGADEPKIIAQLVESPKSSYAGDLVDTTGEVLKSRVGGGEGIGEALAEAYEDEARAKAGVASREQEREGEDLSYGELLDTQAAMDSIIDNKTFPELAEDIGVDNLITAIEVAQDMGARKYAQRMAEKADDPTEWGDHEALAKFAKDMELRETYGKLSEKGLKDAWRAAEAELNDRISDWQDTH